MKSNRSRGLLVDGFTLVELLVVIGIIAVLISVLLPSLSSARKAALRTNCLSNMRNMQVAHVMYMNDNRGFFIQAGLAHGGVHSDEDAAWINTLEKYYGSQLLHRTPVDTSPHWGPAPDGAPIPGAPADQRRRTSYGINSFLLDAGNGENPYGPAPAGFVGDWPGGDGKAYNRAGRVKRHHATVQFLIMAYTGPFAGSDHPHVETWGTHPNPPTRAAQQVQINAHGGPAADWKSLSVYGYLDGHAEVNRFEEVFRSTTQNRFDPKIAQ